jgi:histidine triad (HIT) family protein
MTQCVFCQIVRGTEPASIVWEDDLTIAAVDLRQFHPGHVLVIPRQHLRDVRDLDYATGAAVMATVVRVTRAVAAAFPNQGMSLWHSIGEAAFQEVPHLHIHVHPRILGDRDAAQSYRLSCNASIAKQLRQVPGRLRPIYEVPAM